MPSADTILQKIRKQHGLNDSANVKLKKLNTDFEIKDKFDFGIKLIEVI